MTESHNKHGWHVMGLSLAVAMALALTGTPAFSQESFFGENDVTELEGIDVVGSHIPGRMVRKLTRSVHESPVPIDIIDAKALQSYGVRDMDTLLTEAVPSYSVNRHPLSDEGTLVRPANLRGLPPDSTLILLNGKRRHRSSVVLLQGHGLSDGTHGPDIAVIPAIALKRVEVLRDGASAQYGSDAIAGAINFVLRDAPSGLFFQSTGGQYGEGDGNSIKIAGNMGVPLTNDGFLNLSFESYAADPTSRSVQRTDAQALIAAGNTNVRTPATQVWGAPNQEYDLKLFGNAGLKLGGGELYAFGNWAERKVSHGFFYRNPNGRKGVFRHNAPTTTAEENNLLVASLGSSACGPVTIDAAANYAGNSVLNQDACFAFNQIHPGGFTPEFGGVLRDWSVALGFKGDTPRSSYAWLDSWKYDVSGVIGQNNVQFFLNNNINPQLARIYAANIRDDETPQSSFDVGTQTETDFVLDFDLSNQFETGLFFSPMSVAMGLEYREEEFKVEAGELASYCIDGGARNTCPTLAVGDALNAGAALGDQGFSVGTNGRQGLAPEAAGTFSRGNYAAYFEAEADVFDNLLINADLRYEDYQTIGETLNGKLAAYWQARSDMAFRSSVGTGFRAPTVGQMFFQQIASDVVDSKIVDSRQVLTSDPVAVSLGAKPLTPEKSVNVSVGAVMDFGALAITIDYYNIKTVDRITRTAPLQHPDNEGQPNGMVGVNNGTVRFFTNNFDTTSRGIDIVATYPEPMFGGRTLFTVVGNWNSTNVDKRRQSFDANGMVRNDPDGNPIMLVGDERVLALERGLPQFRLSLTGDHKNGPWRFLTKFHYYGEFRQSLFDDPNFSVEAAPRWIMDTEVSYVFSDDFLNGFTASLGAQNLFNTFPTKNPNGASPTGGLGADYVVNAPYGFNGGFYYWQLHYEM